MLLPETIDIIEVGPRDGLQNEAAFVSTDAKVAFVDLLAATGVREIECSSFVSQKWVPQLSDAAAVFERIRRVPGVIYSALVPNEQGLERAISARVDKVAVFIAASETFSQRNTNGSIAEVLARLRPVITSAKRAGLPVRAYISCVVACPFEGAVSPGRVRDLVGTLLHGGADEIDLGETIGVASPTDIDRLYESVGSVIEPVKTTLHLHDTRGRALACAYRAMQLGVRRFDASCGGLGGCPYAPGAAGNLATEDLVSMADAMGIRTGVRLKGILCAAHQVAAALNRSLTSRVFVADGTGRGCDTGSSTSVASGMSPRR